ncbi:MAG: hypothetical protein LQ346_008333 [Caloplaca aetnensis]|nr:MAG: hypothetical protein LQ346_008333 [Caloplaca aetnensis]
MSGNQRPQSQNCGPHRFKSQEHRSLLAENPSLPSTTLDRPAPIRILARPPVPESLRPGHQPNVGRDVNIANLDQTPPPPRRSLAWPQAPVVASGSVSSPNDTWAQRMRTARQLPEHHPTDTRWPGAPFIPTRVLPRPPRQPISSQSQAPPNNLPPPLIPVRAQPASIPKLKRAAYVLPTVPLRPSDLPSFTRLDIPDEKGLSTTVGDNQQLIVHLDPSQATQPGPLTTAPDEPLPNSQYNRFPMVLNISGRDIALMQPFWDDRVASTGRLSKPISGDSWYLNPREREQRQLNRVRARHDMRNYGSPEWLAMDSESDGE